MKDSALWHVFYYCLDELGMEGTTIELHTMILCMANLRFRVQWKISLAL